ncbi:3-keto reductase [Spathaspora passalidarum NRRL Y-27907]|uniref:3beta-hydroxysteroid 3-dehydrogenase n=1 Tax=Spathaspora passalidarum (strain NRRL Y-27907 / 11-Y1) TaxID=619300 RepID=G3AIT8_SPAPN|nr:3-keto reductase [Spathaspora passalidarum NRRL Y-27907]EGW34504.1 3-keto reductase [Spathaspora passalidarum NRRL Y-27907]
MSLIKDSTVALITGASSNLGFNIAVRLLEQLPQDKDITLIVTSRTLPKAKDSINDIKKFITEKLPQKRGQVEFDYLLVDFTDMVSVLSAYYELSKRYKHLDYFFVNAAQGVYSGIDWVAATVEVFKNPVEAVTSPTYKLQQVGRKSGDGLGLVFQANVFGPYYLIHKLKPLLSNGGKIIWISSLMSQPKYLSFNDLQLVKSPASYEGSKRLVDLLHYGTYKSLKQNYGIESYVVHPGIFTSFSFFQYLNFFTYYGMLVLFYMARWLGSPYHNIEGYIAANAPVAAALGRVKQNEKVGSATTASGKEYLLVEDTIDTTGSSDVVKYLESLAEEWDDKFKDQIVNSRQ